jgi:hypothetical protein
LFSGSLWVFAVIEVYSLRKSLTCGYENVVFGFADFQFRQQAQHINLCLQGRTFITAGQRPAEQARHTNRCLKGKSECRRPSSLDSNPERYKDKYYCPLNILLLKKNQG